MTEPPPPPGVTEDAEEDIDRREEAAVMPGDPVPDEEPASRRGEADPDNPRGAP